jgi:hypothetical protein
MGAEAQPSSILLERALAALKRREQEEPALTGDPRFNVLDWAEKNYEHELTGDQKSALQSIYHWLITAELGPYYVLKGYAGTGKTTLTQLVVKLAQTLLHLRCIGMAPTHKAAAVLGAKLDCEVTTIHSASGFRMERLDEGGHSHYIEKSEGLASYDFAALDEASMTQEELVDALESNRQNCRILIVGDPAQLNPVGESRISKAFRLSKHKSVLKEITRQAANNPLIAASLKIRKAIKYDKDVEIRHLERWLPENHFIPRRKAIIRFLRALERGYNPRILAYRNRTVVSLNRHIHNALFPDAEHEFCVGEPVMMQDGWSVPTERPRRRGEPVYRDYRWGALQEQLALRNSFEFTIKEIELVEHPIYPQFQAYKMLLVEPGTAADKNQAASHAFVPVEDAQVQAEITRLFDIVRATPYEHGKSDRATAVRNAWAFKNAWAQVRHAYTLTIHRSQGSTFDIAYIDFSDLKVMRERFEFLRGLYVAFTRPSKAVRFLI